MMGMMGMGTGDGGAAIFFGWLLYLLVVIALTMGIVALWKYLKEYRK